MKRDFTIFVLSILLAVLLAQTGFFTKFLTATQGVRFLGSFIAGIFFTSFLTVAPATVALGGIAQGGSLIFTAFFGALGAVLGDMILFLIIRDHLSSGISAFFTRLKLRHAFSFLRSKVAKRLIPFLGALVIASPLPDELGLTLMGLSKTQAIVVAPLSFAMNFLGILAVGTIARAL